MKRADVLPMPFMSAWDPRATASGSIEPLVRYVPSRRSRPRSFLALPRSRPTSAISRGGTVKLTDLMPNQRLGHSLSCRFYVRPTTDFASRTQGFYLT